MKRALIAVFILVAFTLAVNCDAYAGIFSFSVNPKSMGHGSAFYWGLSHILNPGETIINASFKFFNINDYAIEPNDIIFVTLLNNADQGIKFKALSDSKKGDYFNGKGKGLFTYTDKNETKIKKYTNKAKTRWKWVNYNGPEDFTYNFSQDDLDDLMFAMGDGSFAFGIDPDCHYSTTGLTFEFETTQTTVPEPASMALVGMGIVGLLARRKKSLGHRQ